MHEFLHHVYAITWLATWGNNMAWLESLAAAGLVAWLARDHIGRHLAAWWDRHHGPHVVKRHKQAMREHEAKGRARSAQGGAKQPVEEP
jgi:hypothetical protein